MLNKSYSWVLLEVPGEVVTHAILVITLGNEMVFPILDLVLVNLTINKHFEGSSELL